MFFWMALRMAPFKQARESWPHETTQCSGRCWCWAFWACIPEGGQGAILGRLGSLGGTLIHFCFYSTGLPWPVFQHGAPPQSLLCTSFPCFIFLITIIFLGGHYVTHLPVWTWSEPHQNIRSTFLGIWVGSPCSPAPAVSSPQQYLFCEWATWLHAISSHHCGPWWGSHIPWLGQPLYYCPTCLGDTCPGNLLMMGRLCLPAWSLLECYYSSFSIFGFWGHVLIINAYKEPSFRIFFIPKSRFWNFYPVCWLENNT